MSKSKKLSSSDLKTFTHLHTLCRLEVNSRLAKYDVKYSQWLILDCLTQEQVDNPSKVASQLGMERATVSRSLDILESRNLVSRTHNLADRRVVEIQVTAQGKKIAQMGVQRLEQIVQSVTGDLSHNQISEIFTLLDVIKDNLNQKIAR